MNILENLQKMNFSNHAKARQFTHATFIREELIPDKLRFIFMLTAENILFSIDIMLKGAETIQFMTGTHNSTQSEQIDGKIDDVLEWFYCQIAAHPLFRLRIATNGLRFKFVKVNGNILYRQQLSFLEKK